MHGKTQDAMAYCRNFDKPDLFVTLTCSPKWPEIEKCLFDGQRSNDREDIVARVFNLKKKTLVKAIFEGQIFGKVRAYMLSVEWQKRGCISNFITNFFLAKVILNFISGLPHMHMLIWLEEHIHPRNMDEVICAEIPDRDEDPELYNLVKDWMLHGPCGNRYTSHI